MIFLAAMMFGAGMPETFVRQNERTRARRHGTPLEQAPALSGTTLPAIARVTVFSPMKMLVSEPIVMMISLYLGFNFAIIFSMFIFVPVVMETVYNFTPQQVGLAFIAAIVGTVLAAVTSIMLDRIFFRRAMRKSRKHGGVIDIEYRLWPAMVGGFGITIALFWIAWTAKPTIPYLAPIFGTLIYVWGNLSVLVSYIRCIENDIILT